MDKSEPKVKMQVNGEISRKRRSIKRVEYQRVNVGSSVEDFQGTWKDFMVG